MSGLFVTGKVMIQEPAASGFECNVYPTRIAAAIQLLRIEVRRSSAPEASIAEVESQVAELIAHERQILADDEDE